MKYAGFMKQSLIDYPGEIATVLFTWGCNFRCPYCHNFDLVIQTKGKKNQDIDFSEIEAFLLKRQNLIDAVVISGGEPTLHPELIEDMRKIKAMGYKIKLDTNGTNTEFLQRLLSEQLLDYVAMDVKHALDTRSYARAAGKIRSADLFSVKASINLLKHADIEVEFRTTVLPALHTPEEITGIARSLSGARLYTLQQFNPRRTLDTRYGEQLPFTREQMQTVAEACQAYVAATRIVNI